MSVEAWLKGLGLERYAAAFDANDVTEDLLPALTSDDLREIGVVSVGHRRRILDAIAAARDPTATAPAPELSPERRRVSVVFCDLEGSTALSARLDPEDLSNLIQAYQALVNEVVARLDGFIARYLGDGVLIYFGWPRAREDDPERAVRAALEVVGAIGKARIRGERLRVRIGIATGLVVIGERIGAEDSLQHTAIGETPNRAARLQGAAAPDSVVIDAPTRQMIGGLFVMREMGALNLAGLAEPVPAWTVISESGVLSRFEALHGSNISPLVGREQELGVLLSRWHAAKAGSGGAVLITGEAGIGKSRLLAALEEQILNEPYVRMRYFCLPHRRETPLGPSIGQLEHAANFTRGDAPAEKIAKMRNVLHPGTSPEDIALLAGMLSIPPDDSMPVLELSARRRRERTLAALLWQISTLARLQPVVMLAEDIQWSDPTSRELLDQMLELLPRLPILLVMTYRPELDTPWSGRAEISVVTLNRLPPKETAEIALRLAAAALPPALIERLVSRSDGVPLFIEELTRAVLEAGVALDSLSAARVPDSLHASLLARLDRLPAAKAAAQIGSVVGRSFSYELVVAIAGMPEPVLAQGLDQLVEAGLATRRGEAPYVTYQFKHALVQDTAYDSMVRPRRAALHAAIVTALEQDLEAGAADPALLAHHCDAAGLIAQAVRYFLSAGEEAAARGAMPEAHTLLIRGLKLAEDNPDIPDVLAWRTRYHLALGEVLGALRFYASPETGTALAEAVTLARSMAHDDPARDRLMARSLFGYVVHQLWLGEFRTVRSLSDELLALGHDRSNPGIATLGVIANGICRVYQGEFVAARAIFNDTLEQWRKIDRPETARAAAEALGMDPVPTLLAFRARLDALLGWPDTAVADTRLALERARGLKHLRSYAFVLGTAWDTFAITREDDDLRQVTADWTALATEQGFQFYLARSRYCSGWVKVQDGDIATGRALIEEATRELEDVGVVLDGPQVHAMLADAREAAGDIDGALAAVERGLEIAASGGGIWWSTGLWSRKAQLSQGSTDEIEQDHRRALDEARRESARSRELHAATAYAAFLLSQDRGHEARDLLAPVLGWFTEGSHRPDQIAAAALLARIDGVT